MLILKIILPVLFAFIWFAANYPEWELDGTDTELYKTNLYSGSDADLDNTAPVDATDGFTSDITLTQKLGCVIDLKFDASGSTDDLVVKIYKRRESTWDGDEEPISQINYDNDGAETIVNLTLDESFGPGVFRLSMQSAGATDTFDIDVEGRYFRMEIATS